MAQLPTPEEIVNSLRLLTIFQDPAHAIAVGQDLLAKTEALKEQAAEVSRLSYELRQDKKEVREGREAITAWNDERILWEQAKATTTDKLEDRDQKTAKALNDAVAERKAAAAERKDAVELGETNGVELKRLIEWEADLKRREAALQKVIGAAEGSAQ